MAEQIKRTTNEVLRALKEKGPLQKKKYGGGIIKFKS